MARTVKDRPDGMDQAVKPGTYIAYAKDDGREIWRMEGFSPRHHAVPYGISLTMGAGAIIDPKSGERTHLWDPWGQFRDAPREP